MLKGMAGFLLFEKWWFMLKSTPHPNPPETSDRPKGARGLTEVTVRNSAT